MSGGQSFGIIIEPLSEADGGDFLARLPDLPGCMSDGETSEEALANVQEAIAAWLETAEENGRSVSAGSQRLGLAN